MKFFLLLFILFYLFTRCPAPGVDRDFEKQVDKIYGDIEGLDPKKARDKEFFRYLLRVAKALEHDEAFQKREALLNKFSNAQDNLTDGLYDELKAETKETLDRLKLAEIEFQENLLAADKEHMLDHDDNKWNPIHQANKKHFTQKDLDLLLGRYKSFMALKDARRREKFNKHEMDKELKYRKSLQDAKSEEERKILEKKKKSQREKKHERMHKPLSGPQLRELWQRSEGLDPEYFDMKTLFKLHDKDNDGHLDEFELETLFLADLEKAYNPDDPDVDMEERDEELERMRETASWVDANGDGRVSLDEMMEGMRKKDFDKDEEYHPLYEEGNEFTEQELKDYKDSGESDTEAE